MRFTEIDAKRRVPLDAAKFWQSPAGIGSSAHKAAPIRGD